MSGAPVDAAAYAARLGLSVDVGVLREVQPVLEGLLDEARKRSLPATPSALGRLYLIPVPRLSTDGSCSLHGELDPTPYDLALALGGRTTVNSLALSVLHELVEHVAGRFDVEWLGVYQAREAPSGRALVKLASSGKPSRAEFPLTEAFAARSTNVAVALSGQPRVIADVRAHVAAGGAYYECDPAVRSEACLPLLDAGGRVVGVLDAESSRPDDFSGERLAALAALAVEAGANLPR